MDPLINELSRRYDAFPKHYKALVLGGSFVLIADQVMRFGESIGRALYYLTH